MKANILIIAILISALQLPAQTNATVRLALVSESPDALAAADVLTAELSSHKNLQLLERNEIERVYREQGLSAANTDYLKLGQVLARMDCCCSTSTRPAGNQPDHAAGGREAGGGAVG